MKIPVQELRGQRGEGAYFRENTAVFLIPIIAPVSAIRGHVTLQVGVVSKDRMILSNSKLERILSN